MIISHYLVRVCCLAGIAKCLACTTGQSIEEFCSDDANKDVVGCPSKYETS